MTDANLKVDSFLRRAKRWRAELEELRRIILDCELTEELKWGKPCYTFQKANLLVICEFKDACVLNFLKGSLLKDAKRVLAPPGENSQSARLIRFTSVREIAAMESTLKAYTREAIKLEESGAKVKFKKITEHKLPEELQDKFDDSPGFKTAFRALTPGRQRAYLLHFSAAKQSKTRVARIEKCAPRILKGKGLDD